MMRAHISAIAYDNPKLKSLPKYATACASHPVGTHLKVRDYAIANLLLLRTIGLGIGRCPRHPNKNPKENLKPKEGVTRNRNSVKFWYGKLDNLFAPSKCQLNFLLNRSSRWPAYAEGLTR